MLDRWRAGLALVAALAAACRSPAPDVPAVEAPAPSGPKIETRETQLDGDFITVRLHIPPTPEPRKPAVISFLGEHASLLARGYLVATYRINWDVRNPPSAAPPAPEENPVGKWILASPSPGVLGRRYLRVIATNAEEVVPKVLDYLATVPEVDPARLGIAGGSTNGFIALEAVARDRRLVAAAVLTACGDYHLFLRDSSLGMEGAPLVLEPAYDRWLRSIEPIHRAARMTHAAVLMVNRDGDPIIPIACADSTARVLARGYARAGVPDRFRYRVIEAAVHGLDARDVEETLAWFDRWLRPPRAAPRGRPRRGRAPRAPAP
jgi:dienelactone hydrolase